MADTTPFSFLLLPPDLQSRIALFWLDHRLCLPIPALSRDLVDAFSNPHKVALRATKRWGSPTRALKLECALQLPDLHAIRVILRIGRTRNVVDVAVSDFAWFALDALLVASKSANLELLKALLEERNFQKESPQLRWYSEREAGDAYEKDLRCKILSTLLILAARDGHAAIAAVLLDYWALIHGGTALGNTGLMVARKGGHIEVFRMLLDSGAPIDQRSLRARRRCV